MMGRTFLAEEEYPGKDHEVILGYDLWKNRYGGDTAIVGHVIKVDSEDYTVVGVLPHDFGGQFWGLPGQLWVPIGYTKAD